MNLKGLIYPVFLLGFAFTSCLLEEAPNAECDITAAHLTSEYLKGAPVIENNRITFMAKPSIDLTGLAPEFQLTEGAVIVPESGTTRDFSTPQTYTVTSEDKKWSKEYTVRFNLAEVKTKYSFEHYEKNGKFYDFFEWSGEPETEGSEKQYIWACGNKVFILGNTDPNSFPTSVEEDGLIGKGLRLETKSAGAWGAGMKMPIATGSLFMGTFDSKNAIKEPLKATNFGLPFAQKPARLKGWYKYAPGNVVTDKNNQVVADRIDSLDIYAVLYEPTPEKPFLTGDNVLTDESIIAIARIKDKTAKENFTPFNLPFIYKEDKIFDKEKMLDYKYNLTIVFSSSIDGAYFIGAAGSKLIVDEVELVCEEVE